VRVIRRHHPLRSECAHVQPDRGRTGAAIEQEHDGPVSVLPVAAEIRHIRHPGFGRLRRRRTGSILTRAAGIVVQGILHVHDQDPGFGLIAESVSADRDRP